MTFQGLKTVVNDPDTEISREDIPLLTREVDGLVVEPNSYLLYKSLHTVFPTEVAGEITTALS